MITLQRRRLTKNWPFRIFTFKILKKLPSMRSSRSRVSKKRRIVMLDMALSSHSTMLKGEKFSRQKDQSVPMLKRKESRLSSIATRRWRGIWSTKSWSERSRKGQYRSFPLVKLWATFVRERSINIFCEFQLPWRNFTPQMYQVRPMTRRGSRNRIDGMQRVANFYLYPILDPTWPSCDLNQACLLAIELIFQADNQPLFQLEERFLRQIYAEMRWEVSLK